MVEKRRSHLIAVLQALLVTFLWSTSFVLIKIGLGELPPFLFAGLRYVLAFLCLLPFALRPVNRDLIRSLSTHDWRRLIVLGLLFLKYISDSFEARREELKAELEADGISGKQLESKILHRRTNVQYALCSKRACCVVW